MNDDAKKNPTPYDVSDALFAGMVDKAKQYDEIVANLVAGHKIRPNETGDFQAVLSVVANMASAKVATFDPAWLPVQEAAERVINNRQRPQFFGILEALNQKPNEIVLRFEELVSNLHKIGVIDQPFPKPDEVVRVVLAPFLAGWKPNDYTMSVTPLSDPYAGIFGIQRKEQDDAIQDAKNGDFTKLAKLVGRPELVAPMKHIIAARKTLANGRVLGGETLQSMCDAAVKDVDTLARIFDTLQHYGQLRSASALQSIKDLCNEYETVFGVLSKERGFFGDRVSGLVLDVLNQFDRLTEDRKQIAAMFDDEVEAQDREHWSGRTDSADAIMWAIANVCNQRNQYRAALNVSGTLESTDEPMFLELVRARVAKSRRKMPQSGRLSDLLSYATNDLSDVLVSQPIGKVIKKAVKIAALAWRIAEEGDDSYNAGRTKHNQTPFPVSPISVDETRFFEMEINLSTGETKVGPVLPIGALNNPNHPEAALFRIGKALVDAGQLDPEEATRFGECAFAVEVMLSNKQSGDALLNRIGERIEKTGFLIGKDWNQETLLAALEAIIQNGRTNVGDAQLKVRQQEREAAKALVDLSYILNPDGLLSIPELLEQVAQLKANAPVNIRGKISMLTALETIREVVMTAEGNHNQYNSTDDIVDAVNRHFRKMKEGVENWHILGALLVDSKALDKNAPLSFVNVRTAIGNLIEKQFKTMGLANQLKDDVEDLASKLSAQVDERGNIEDHRDELLKRNDAQKYCIETIGGTVGNNDGTLPSIWSAVRDLAEHHEKALAHIGEVRNMIFGTFPDRPLLDYPSIIATLQDLIHVRMFAREAEIVLGEIGPKYVGTLVERARQAVRVVNATTRANIEGIKRLAAAVAKVNGVDLGDPSSFESIEAAILNLGWDRDRHVAALRQQYIALPRAFADGQRVFVHYFDGCSDEYLGQKAAEIRGAKYVSGQFGWFYMVEFEEAGIGAYNFDYPENRLALVPEAYLLPGDRVRLRDSQTEGVVVSSGHYQEDAGDAIRYQLAEAEGDGGSPLFGVLESNLIPIDQVWSIFHRKEGKTRLLVIHAPDKWEAERRAAQRLSKAGKPYVTPALIAIPGVADNAHYGGVTTDVEVKVNRVSGRDINLLWSIRFPGNDVDAANVREAIGTLISTDRTSSGERIDKMLPRLRGLKNEFDTVPGEPSPEAIASRKFNDGQLVSYIESKETGRQLAFVAAIQDESVQDGRLYDLRTLAQGATLAGESRLRFEADLLPESKFKEGQRVIAKRRNSEGENFAKILFASYSDWSKKWEYQIEITAHSLKTSRWEEDLEAVPAIGHDALIQQAVTDIVDREEDAAMGAIPEDSELPVPLFRNDDEVQTKSGATQVWVITDRRWSNKRNAWLYDAKAKQGSTTVGNMNEDELRPYGEAVLSRFLAASAELQAEADKMVGKFVDVATDAKERAIRDGAINPDWLNWIQGVVGRRYMVISAAVLNDGQVTFKIDSEIFSVPAKYTTYV